jgi:hypothetical protein
MAVAIVIFIAYFIIAKIISSCVEDCTVDTSKLYKDSNGRMFFKNACGREFDISY